MNRIELTISNSVVICNIKSILFAPVLEKIYKRRKTLCEVNTYAIMRKNNYGGTYMEMVLLTALGVGGATVSGAVIVFVFKSISHKLLTQPVLCWPPLFWV